MQLTIANGIDLFNLIEFIVFISSQGFNWTIFSSIVLLLIKNTINIQF